MKYIAHRGLFDGPNKSKENSPSQIKEAVGEGFDSEIDLWMINKQLWLGHDSPQYLIDISFIEKMKTYLWIHAKNLEALYWLTNTQYTYFWHQNDKFTLTSNNYIWTYPGNSLSMKSISVMPEWADPNLQNVDTHCYGICSDYISKIRSTYK